MTIGRVVLAVSFKVILMNVCVSRSSVQTGKSTTHLPLTQYV